MKADFDDVLVSASTQEVGSNETKNTMSNIIGESNSLEHNSFLTKTQKRGLCKNTIKMKL